MQSYVEPDIFAQLSRGLKKVARKPFRALLQNRSPGKHIQPKVRLETQKSHIRIGFTEIARTLGWSQVCEP